MSALGLDRTGRAMSDRYRWLPSLAPPTGVALAVLRSLLRQNIQPGQEEFAKRPRLVMRAAFQKLR